MAPAVGFTIVRNAIQYDFPVLESIRSILPLVQELYIGLGRSDDGTEALIESLNEPKIKVIPTVWDERLRVGGRVLAEETNKVFDQIPSAAGWCLYLQADEVIHEKDYPAILRSMETHAGNPAVEGLLFGYRHFYGSYDYLGDSRKWYSHEIRIIRNDKRIRSYRDAQGFRKDGRKLRVKPVDAQIYHYGWVREPRVQQQKINDFHRLWTADDEPLLSAGAPFDYSEIDSLDRFQGTHPAAMQERIRRLNWRLDLDIRQKRFSAAKALLYWIEKKTGKRLFAYHNYTRI